MNNREKLKDKQRIIVKVGTSSLILSLIHI